MFMSQYAKPFDSPLSIDSHIPGNEYVGEPNTYCSGGRERCRVEKINYLHS